MIYRITLTVLTLLALIYLAAQAVDFNKVRDLLGNFPKDKLLILVSISICISILKAWRFLILLRNNNIKVSFWENLKAFITSQAATPLPGGEAFRGVLVSKETGERFLKTTAPVITQAYLELFTAGLITLIGSLLLKAFRIPALILIASLILMALVLANKRILENISRKFTKWEKINNFFNKLKVAQIGIRNNLYDPETHLPDKVLVRSLALSILTNLMGGFLIFITANYLQIPLDIFHAVFIYAASIAIGAIAFITPGGLGFTEGGMIGLLTLSKVGIVQAFSLVLIFRLVTLVFNIMLGLIFFLIFYSKSMLFPKKRLAKI